MRSNDRNSLRRMCEARERGTGLGAIVVGIGAMEDSAIGEGERFKGAQGRKSVKDAIGGVRREGRQDDDAKVG